MGTVGIIAEFNPLHPGHEEHINESKKLTGGSVIIVMSGNFVQRGEPAIVDKWFRTEAALKCGVDIVVELPVCYVLCGADYFARGAVCLLEKCGIVKSLSFGSECGEIAAISKAADVLVLEPDEFKKVLKKRLGLGFSFAAARGFALDACLPGSPEGLFTRPNNGLGIEYVKAVKLLGSKMEVLTTHRKPGGPSATKIRNEMLGGEGDNTCYGKRECGAMVQKKCNKYVRLDDFSDIFKYLLFTRKDLCLGEGLENRFRKFAGDFTKISDLIDAVKTKRYTHTRLQRAVLRTVLGLPNDCGKPGYIRVLGFKRESASLLGSLVKNAKLPVITTGKGIEEILARGGDSGFMLKKEIEAGDIYRIAKGGKGGHLQERGHGIVVV